MIVFDLRCLDGGEVFEAWFRSGSDFDDQFARGLVQCPFCSSTKVEKAPMAPRLPPRSSSVPDFCEIVSRAAALQARLLAGSTWVGDELPQKARAMHSGEIEPEPVHGRATVDEARSLLDEGVPLVPLPLPIVPPDQVN